MELGVIVSVAVPALTVFVVTNHQFASALSDTPPASTSMYPAVLLIILTANLALTHVDVNVAVSVPVFPGV